MDATKNRRTTSAEKEKLLKEFSESLEGETFFGHAFISEGKNLDEPTAPQMKITKKKAYN